MLIGIKIVKKYKMAVLKDGSFFTKNQTRNPRGLFTDFKCFQAFDIDDAD